MTRIVVPGLPHHVTLRGNHRAAMFFEAGGDALYRDLLAAETRKAQRRGLGLGADAQSCASGAGAFGCVRSGRSHVAAAPALCGICQCHSPALPKHLVQERFGSVVMDEALILAALRYAALNPVRAGLVARSEDWPWSSVAAQVPNSPIFWAGPRTIRISGRCGRPRDMAGRWDQPYSSRPSKPASAARSCRANLAGNRNG